MKVTKNTNKETSKIYIPRYLLYTVCGCNDEVAADEGAPAEVFPLLLYRGLPRPLPVDGVIAVDDVGDAVGFWVSTLCANSHTRVILYFSNRVFQE